MSDTIPTNDDVARAQRFVRAAAALLPEWYGGDEAKLMFSVTKDGLIGRLSDTGILWRGESVADILAQAEDWVRSTAAETVKTRRESLDAAMARQRAAEEALGQ